jgi:hypothetical protein
MVTMVTVFIPICDRVPGDAQKKTIKLGFCWFSAKHAAIRSKSKDMLALNRIICPNGVKLLYQCTLLHYNKSQLNVLV